MAHGISQNQKVLGFLRLRGKITPLQAQKYYGIMRLGARIHELKKKGYYITSKLIETRSGNRVAQYTLETAQS